MSIPDSNVGICVVAGDVCSSAVAVPVGDCCVVIDPVDSLAVVRKLSLVNPGWSVVPKVIFSVVAGWYVTVESVDSATVVDSSCWITAGVVETMINKIKYFKIIDINVLQSYLLYTMQRFVIFFANFRVVHTFCCS